MMMTMTMMIMMIGMMMMMMMTMMIGMMMMVMRIGKCGLTAELRLHARKLPSAHLQNTKTQKQNIPHKSKTNHTKASPSLPSTKTLYSSSYMSFQCDGDQNIVFLMEATQDFCPNTNTEMYMTRWEFSG